MIPISLLPAVFQIAGTWYLWGALLLGFIYLGYGIAVALLLTPLAAIAFFARDANALLRLSLLAGSYACYFVAFAAQVSGEAFVAGPPEALAGGEDHDRIPCQRADQARLELAGETDLPGYRKLGLVAL